MQSSSLDPPPSPQLPPTAETEPLPAVSSKRGSGEYVDADAADDEEDDDLAAIIAAAKSDAAAAASFGEAEGSIDGNEDGDEETDEDLT